MNPPIITLLTDFGLQDGYVASMKGVILAICPDAKLVDISHLIAPRDIRSGAFVLYTSYGFFPQGTIHLAVVDPGVGTERGAVAIRTRSCFFVGPDNGLFSFVLKGARLGGQEAGEPAISEMPTEQHVSWPRPLRARCGTYSSRRQF